jgi:hypothetical protein
VQGVLEQFDILAPKSGKLRTITRLYGRKGLRLPSEIPP